MGGDNSEQNLIELCPNCHGRLHSRKYFLYWSAGIYFMVNLNNHKDIINPINLLKKEKREYPIKSIITYSENNPENVSGINKEKELNFDELIGKDLGNGLMLESKSADGFYSVNFPKKEGDENATQ